MKNRNIVICLIVIIAIGVIGILLINKHLSTKEKEVETPEVKKPMTYEDTDYNTRLIKTVNSSYKENYLISPYSIEIALNMLKVGANGDTQKQITSVLPDRTVNDVINKNVKVANALFIKNKYKDVIVKDFYDKLKYDYSAEMLYDEFSTPKVINDWVNEHTDGMIPKLMDNIDPEFVLGLANALAIDVKWQSTFECTSTYSEKFTKIDDTTFNVQMMHDTYSSTAYKYFDENDAKGVILPYETDSELEFVGIIPNSSVSDYINDLDFSKLNNMLSNAKEASNKTHILLSLPRFSYNFNLSNFKDILQAMGIKNAFNGETADFTNIITKEDLRKFDVNNIYVSDAIHKTYIDLNEDGTKAAAVTGFMMEATSALPEMDYKEIKIEFNKPFIYMIRNKNNKELLFFGVVYEPNEWNGSTCSN